MKIILLLVLLSLVSCKNSPKLNNIEKNIDIAQINITDREGSFNLVSSDIKKSNEYIKMKFYNSTGSDYELRIEGTNNNFTSEYVQTFSVLDSSYRKPTFKIIEQSLILNKTKYKVGDSIIGKIRIKILANYTCEKYYIDTLKVRGFIRDIVH